MGTPGTIQIRENSIHSNGALGIDLGDDGVTPNDPADGDSGVNGRQNFPILSSAVFNANLITIGGKLSSAPSSSYRLRFFRSAACDPSGNGEGETFLGSLLVSTDAAGEASFHTTFSGAGSGVVTATATDSPGNTSEFSPCLAMASSASVEISVHDVAVLEGDAGTSPASFLVTLSTASLLPVSVNFATADATASASSDYVAANGILTFAPLETSKTIPITINGDSAVEPDETFTVNLSTPVNATIADGEGSGTIKADDGLSVISISDTTVAEGDSATATATFNVTLSAPSPFVVSVSFATADDTASSATDYLPTTGSLTFAAGETSKSVSVSVNGDITREPDETFFVNLFNPSSVSMADPQGAGTITNDDPIPTAGIGDASFLELNSGSRSRSITATLSNPSSTTIHVFFEFVEGTATSGVDYFPNAGSFTFVPGETSAMISFTVVGDTVLEPDETLFVNLTSANGATIGDSQAVVTILNDDGVRGDADGNGTREVADILFLLAYLFGGGAAPPNAVNGDADSSGSTDVADVFFLVNHFFSEGPAPAP